MRIYQTHKHYCWCFKKWAALRLIDGIVGKWQLSHDFPQSFGANFIFLTSRSGLSFMVCHSIENYFVRLIFFTSLDLAFFWPAKAAKVAKNATAWHLRGADCLRTGNLQILCNPLHIGIKRLHFFAASSGQKMLDREKWRFTQVLQFNSLLNGIVKI